MTVLDKHGQLGIWDAQAPPDEAEDEDGDVTAEDDAEGGRYWRLQPHWPATAKSSISAIKFDPIDAHSVSTQAGLHVTVLTYDVRYLLVHMTARSVIHPLLPGYPVK